MEAHGQKLLRTFRFNRVLIPVILGLGVSSYFIYRDYDADVYRAIDWTWWSVVYLSLAFLMMAVRDLAYMYRIRLITGKELSWRRSLDVIFLWEFASCLTPSVVGGSAIALFILNREGLKLGKSTALVMVTALFDELFYLTVVPLALLLVGFSDLFVGGNFSFLGLTGLNTQTLFFAGYGFIFLLTTVISFGVFIRPGLLKRIFTTLCSVPFLRRWKQQATTLGDEIITTSKEMRGRPLLFWLRLYISTFLSWTGRFLVINFLILAIGIQSDQLLVYARQLVMWVILLISPTPGSSGIAEFIFPVFFGDIVGEFSGAIALSWRMISFYLYLVIGAVILPIWVRRVLKKR